LTRKRLPQEEGWRGKVKRNNEQKYLLEGWKHSLTSNNMEHITKSELEFVPNNIK